MTCWGLPEVTSEMVEALKLRARTEGILLNLVYTGKAMAGLIDLIQKGHFNSDETILFLHTGGHRVYMHICLIFLTAPGLLFPVF
jgi:1-aminocyclopropane-1-carboxylate deaminase/D-cysteine desulfhydrase-like pyridoxal-dependent ACC family enzyme